MKLQKSVSSKTANKIYEKWFLNIPLKIINQVGWNAGDEIVATTNNGKIILDKQDKIKLKENKKPKLTYYEKFIKVYNDLPLDERKMPIIVIDNEAFTWSRCNKEINGQTKLGKEIGERLIKLNFI
jgi:bifunctional DNA-binding transcriptional regulator/antitoxin component of YhaV-PrlF toxin-antitoxin module